MHLYIITRGIKNSVDQFITELQGKYLPYKWREKNEDAMKDCMLQVSVRPIQLWEIAFPEEHKDLMLTTILGEKGDEDMRDKGILGWLNKLKWTLCTFLGLEKITKYDTSKVLPIQKANVQISGIGLKKDYIMPNGAEGI